MVGRILILDVVGAQADGRGGGVAGRLGAGLGRHVRRVGDGDEAADLRVTSAADARGAHAALGDDRRVAEDGDGREVRRGAQLLVRVFRLDPRIVAAADAGAGTPAIGPHSGAVLDGDGIQVVFRVARDAPGADGRATVDEGILRGVIGAERLILAAPVGVETLAGVGGQDLGAVLDDDCPGLAGVAAADGRAGCRRGGGGGLVGLLAQLPIVERLGDDLGLATDGDGLPARAIGAAADGRRAARRDGRDGRRAGNLDGFDGD